MGRVLVIQPFPPPAGTGEPSPVPVSDLRHPMRGFHHDPALSPRLPSPIIVGEVDLWL